MTYINTRERYTEAILSLAKTKPIQDITVTNIVNRSGLSRQSFYVYYRDKYDLINQIFDNDLERAAQSIQSELSFTDLHTEASLESLRGKASFYAKALEYNGQNSLYKHMKDVISQGHLQIVLSHMKVHDPDLLRKIQYYVDFHSSCATAAIVDWLRQGARVPPSEVAALIVDSIPSMIQQCYNFRNLQSYTYTMYLNGGGPGLS